MPYAPWAAVAHQLQTTPIPKAFEESSLQVFAGCNQCNCPCTDTMRHVCKTIMTTMFFADKQKDCYNKYLPGKQRHQPTGLQSVLLCEQRMDVTEARQPGHNIIGWDAVGSLAYSLLLCHNWANRQPCKRSIVLTWLSRPTTLPNVLLSGASDLLPNPSGLFQNSTSDGGRTLYSGFPSWSRTSTQLSSNCVSSLI